MTRLDLYIFRLTLPAFGFFALVLVGIIWLSQTLAAIEDVLATGSSGLVLLELSLLLLPEVGKMVMPIAGFAAALYITSKLAGDSELVVMASAGRGPVALVRGMALFALCAGAAMMLLTLVLAPAAYTRLKDREVALRTEAVSLLIAEGQFTHPAEGVTVYVRDNPRDGTLTGIFIEDAREPDSHITYSAERALLVRSGGTVQLVMLEGTALDYSPQRGSLTTARFDRTSYDLTQFLGADGPRTPNLRELPLGTLLFPGEDPPVNARIGEYVAKGHERLVLPLLGALMPLVAMSTLLAGRFARRGNGWRVGGAVLAAAALQLPLGVINASIYDDWRLWPLYYAPVLAGAAYVAWMLRAASASRGPVPA